MTVNAVPNPVAPATTSGVTRRVTRPEIAAELAQRFGAAVVLGVVLLLGTGLYGTNFASGQNFGNIALDSSYLVLIAIGMTFVIISGGIDLSVGSMLALSGVLAAFGSRWGTFGAVVLPLVVCGAIGLANGLLVGRARIAPFIVTLETLNDRGLEITAARARSLGSSRR